MKQSRFTISKTIFQTSLKLKCVQSRKLRIHIAGMKFEEKEIPAPPPHKNKNEYNAHSMKNGAISDFSILWVQIF